MAEPQQPNARDPKKPSEDTASVNYNAAFADLRNLNALGHQKLEIDQLGEQPTLEEYYPELVSKPSQNSTMAAKRSGIYYTNTILVPSGLSRKCDLVTERDGKTYEFFTYNRGEKKCTSTMPIPLGLVRPIDLIQRRKMRKPDCTTARGTINPNSACG